MKNLIYLLIVIISTSCSDSTTESNINSTAELNQSTTAESNEENARNNSKSERESFIVDMFLKSDAEKIGLLSVIKNVPHEKTNSVLKDYLSKTLFSEEFQNNKSSEYIEKLVDSIANKNKVPIKLTASIIFSYNYEMITKDEIIDDYENLREEYSSR